MVPKAMIPFLFRCDLSRILRGIRGWWYRQTPGLSRRAHGQRRKGFERPCGAENHAHTQQMWVEFLGQHGLIMDPGAVIVELAAGDGVTGSLGVWLEDRSHGARCFLWEHRPVACEESVRLRPAARVWAGRLTEWRRADLPDRPWLVSSGCSRQSAAIWRAIRQKVIRPGWLILWNPSGRPVWWRRARQVGYRLRWVHHHREYYRPA